MPLMNVEHGTGRLLSIKHSPLLNLNQPTSHSWPAAPQWDNSDLIIAFIQPPKPVIANSDDLANNDDIHSCLIEIFLGDCISNSGMKFVNANITMIVNHIVLFMLKYLANMVFAICSEIDILVFLKT